MSWPFQRIDTLSRRSSQAADLIVAASGSRLFITNYDEGAIIAEWSTSCNESNGHDNSGERPAKRQRVQDGPVTSSIILLSTSTSSDYFAVVTDAKNIHVLKLDDDQKIVETSRRCMPKRPCAIQILPDEQLILCADKFGDVYSLPLLPDLEADTKYAQASMEAAAQQPTTFKTSASELTVHTKRNLRALESQQNQKHFSPRKSALAFEHKLLLGHVSMLTDLVYVKDDVNRGRIITADRDEHIRVSRGPSQAHIIEGFCLGHTEFISRLCLIPSTTLVAGAGGDDWIGVWDWTGYELKHKVDIKQALVQKGIANPDKFAKIAVAGLGVVPLSSGSHTVLVAWCEKMEAIVLVSIPYAEGSAQVHVAPMDGIPLSITQVRDQLIISLIERDSKQKRLLAYSTSIDDGSMPALRHDEQASKALQALNDVETQPCDPVALDRSLYTTATLRKRGGWDDSQGGEEE